MSSLPPHVKRRTCEELYYTHPSKAAFLSFKGVHSHHMIVDNRSMESVEEEALLGQESEDENSELSDNEVSELTC